MPDESIALLTPRDIAKLRADLATFAHLRGTGKPLSQRYEDFEREVATLERFQSENARLVRENVRLQQDLAKWRAEMARSEARYHQMAQERVLGEDEGS